MHDMQFELDSLVELVYVILLIQIYRKSGLPRSKDLRKSINLSKTIAILLLFFWT